MGWQRRADAYSRSSQHSLDERRSRGPEALEPAAPFDEQAGLAAYHAALAAEAGVPAAALHILPAPAAAAAALGTGEGVEGCAACVPSDAAALLREHATLVRRAPAAVPMRPVVVMLPAGTAKS